MHWVERIEAMQRYFNGQPTLKFNPTFLNNMHRQSMSKSGLTQNQQNALNKIIEAWGIKIGVGDA